MAIADKSVARDCLRDVLDETDARKVFADALGIDEPLLSKKLNGTQGRDFGLGELESLDRDVQVKWLKRYGKLIGLDVHEVSAGALLEEFIAQFEQMQRLTTLVKARIGKPAMARAELSEQQEKRSA